MNGIHDLGGMDGFGAIPYEAGEPVFHESWEGRVFALVRACGYLGKWTLDGSRFAQERIPPAEYLQMSYYERWLRGLETQLIAAGMITGEEIERRAGELAAAARPEKGA